MDDAVTDWRLASEVFANNRGQFARAYRLGDELGKPRFACAFCVARLIVRGHRDDRDMARSERSL